MSFFFTFLKTDLFLNSYIFLRFKINRTPLITIQLVLMGLSCLTLFRLIITIIIFVTIDGAISM